MNEISLEEFHDSLYQLIQHKQTNLFDITIEVSHFSMDMINNKIKYKLINSKHKRIINYYYEIENTNILVIHHMN